MDIPEFTESVSNGGNQFLIISSLFTKKTTMSLLNCWVKKYAIFFKNFKDIAKLSSLEIV